MVKMFYVQGCPKHKECSIPSFKRASCKGETVQEARDRLKMHLMNSDLHNCTSAEANTLAREADVKGWNFETNDDIFIESYTASSALTPQQPAVLRGSAAEQPLTTRELVQKALNQTVRLKGTLEALLEHDDL